MQDYLSDYKSNDKCHYKRPRREDTAREKETERAM